MEVWAKSFRKPQLKVEGAISCWDRFSETAALGVSAERKIAQVDTCGIKSMELKVGVGGSLAPFGDSGSPKGGVKVFLKAYFLGGLADYQYNILEF